MSEISHIILLADDTSIIIKINRKDKEFLQIKYNIFKQFAANNL